MAVRSIQCALLNGDPAGQFTLAEWNEKYDVEDEYALATCLCDTFIFVQMVKLMMPTLKSHIERGLDPTAFHLSSRRTDEPRQGPVSAWQMRCLPSTYIRQPSPPFSVLLQP